MDRLEETTLQYLAHEGFCSAAELALFIQLQIGGGAEESRGKLASFLVQWDSRGWLGRAESEPAEHVYLLDLAFQDLGWLRAPA